MRLISCEKRLVIMPVSVEVKNLRGALINVCKAAWWSFEPETRIIVLKQIKKQNRSDPM